MKIIITSLLLVITAAYGWAMLTTLLIDDADLAKALSLLGTLVIGFKSRSVVEWAYGYTLLDELRGKNETK